MQPTTDTPLVIVEEPIVQTRISGLVVVEPTTDTATTDTSVVVVGPTAQRRTCSQRAEADVQPRNTNGHAAQEQRRACSLRTHEGVQPRSTGGRAAQEHRRACGLGEQRACSGKAQRACSQPAEAKHKRLPEWRLADKLRRPFKA